MATTTFEQLRKSVIVSSNDATAQQIASGDTTDVLYLNGEAQHAEATNRVIQFSGSLHRNAQNGSFYYAEREGSTINYNIDAPASIRTQVETLLFATVADIHTEFDTTSEEE